MKSRFIRVAVAAVVLLLVASFAFAEENGAEHNAKAKASKTAKAVRNVKKPTNIKMVDVNSARKEALKKLPGINASYADKIIAGRPYGSKAFLVSHNILPAEVYEGIKNKIIAKQPFKDAARNAALYSKKK